MRRPSRVLVATLLATAVAACASNDQGRTRGSAPGSPRESGRLTAVTSPMIEVQLDQLEDELRLGKDQQPAWERYAARVSSLMEEVRRSREPVAATGGDAIGQVDSLVATARSRVVALESIAGAARDLYPLLTPTQRAIADRRLAQLVAPSLGLSGNVASGPRP